MTNDNLRIAIIGAGMAGVACAKTLHDAGLAPIIFEKSRGLGGRLATRRTGDGLAFDHGAQVFSVRAEDFAQFIMTATTPGDIQPWRNLGWPDESATLVGAPSMNAFIKSVGADLDIRTNTRVTAITRANRQWRLQIDNSADEDFDIVVSTAPAPQTAALATEAPDLALHLAPVTMTPCWTVMAAFEEPLDCPFDHWRSNDHALTWMARNSSKPDRSAAQDCWVMQASSRWSDAHLEQDKPEIIESILKLASEILPARLPETLHTDAHRWRYAHVVEPLGKPFAHNEDHSFYAGGDWCLGPLVEDAYLSGAIIARAIVRNIAQRPMSGLANVGSPVNIDGRASR